jgi:hypothetical protein
MTAHVIELTAEEEHMVEGVLADYNVTRERAIEIVLIGTRGMWADDVIDEPED